MEVNVKNHQFKDLLSKAKKILILIGSEPNFDVVSAGLALNNLLESRDKISHLVSSGKLPDGTSVLSGVDEIKNDLESKKLVISLDYEKNPIDNISYKIEGKTFNLIVKPRTSSLNLDEVQTSFIGADYNLIIVLGTKDIRSLGVYGEHREIFDSLPSINIDVDKSNTRFGKLNIVDSKIESVCGLLSLLLNDTGINLPEKSANLMLAGMREATQNFTKVMGPAIFEAAAYTAKSKGSEETRLSEVSAEEKEDDDLPKEWLSPKIYRSSKVS
jgi:nanoRNase/pAp phosphatase (c-di-AMP/oligoRNAs hydrolase)